MKIETCPKCLKNRFNDSPRSYVWWTIKGQGRMCWRCAEPFLKRFRKGMDVSPAG